MDVTRRPDLTQTFQESYVTEETSGTSGEIEPSVPDDSQSMKNSLHLETASGFGEWPVLISTRGEKHLRQVRAGDGKNYLIVVKKIRFFVASRSLFEG
jgi:hypothetical protein